VPVAYLTGHLSVVVLATVAAVLSALDAFFLPALQASLPRLVEPAALTPMVSLLDSTDRLGRVLGPGAIGLLTAIPQIHLFTADAVTFLISAGCFVAVRTHAAPPAVNGPAGRPTGTPRSGWAALVAGWRVTAHRPVLRDALVLRGLCNLAWPAFTLAAPFLISERFHHGLGAYGVLLAVFGAGNLAGNVLAGRIAGPSLPPWCCRAWALTGIGFAGLAVAPTYPVFAVVTAGIGVCTPLANVTINAHIARTVAPDLLARVYAVQRVIVTAATTAGLPAIAALLGYASPTTTMLVGAAVITVAGAVALGRQHRGSKWTGRARSRTSDGTDQRCRCVADLDQTPAHTGSGVLL
jgi:DHA3 family macrolide efflux protein-like MFS transporter